MATRHSTTAQLLATLAVSSVMANLGIILAMPTFIIGALRLQDSDLKFSIEEASWFGSLIFVSQPLASLSSGFLQGILGRTTTMMVATVPQLAAWLVMYYATSASTLFVCVVILGMTIGCLEAPTLSYIGETSEPRLRGVFSLFSNKAIQCGHMLEVLCGAFLDWRRLMLVNAVASVTALVAVALVPESPAWLVTKGRVEDAQKAYQWLRGWVPPEAVQEELDAMVAYVKQKQLEEASASGGVSGLSKIKILLEPSYLRPLKLVVTYFFISTCAGLSAFQPFFIEILTSLQLPVRPNLVVLFTAAMSLMGAITAVLTLRYLGKRGLSFVSLGLCIACCMGLGLYLALEITLPWIPLVLFTVSYFAKPFGISFVPWSLLSEIFPLNGRGLATGVSSGIAYLMIFAVSKTFYNLVSLVDLSGACFVYGSVGVLGLVYLYYRLPETEGVPLEEIERHFTRNR